ncbi:MAG: hypothetical protein H0W94_00910 [Actinobacteria bacterium]|nr:hypothetical protein [Actinomycetota bacterium]
MERENEKENEDESLTTADLAASADRVDEAERIDQSATEAPDREVATPESGPPTLLPAEERESLTSRWESVQTAFVDEPRRSVTEADQLVADVMSRLADTFAQERSRLEALWDRGDEVSTEDLRVALQRYREFFQRLLTA